MPRTYEADARPFPAVTFSSVCQALAACGLPGDIALSQVMALIDFVLLNPTVFDHWYRSDHPRQALGERRGNRGWETFAVNCFSTWSNWRGLDGPPLPFAGIASFLDSWARLAGLDRYPANYSTDLAAPPASPDVLIGFEAIRPPLLLVSAEIECSNVDCQRRRLHLATDATHAASSFAIRSGALHFCQSPISKCTACNRHFAVDDQTDPPDANGRRLRRFSNNVPFVRVGDNLFVDAALGKMQEAAIYRFHANFASFANFVFDSLGIVSPVIREQFRFTQRHAKSLFVQSSIRRLAASVDRVFHSASDLNATALAEAAYVQLANPTPGVQIDLGGYFPAGRTHACDVCHLPAVPAPNPAGGGPGGLGPLDGQPLLPPANGQEVNCAAIDGLVVGPYVSCSC
jgi:hypothetical protein